MNKTRESIILGITGFSHLLVHTQMLVFPTLLLVFKSYFNLGLDTLGYMATMSAFMFGLGALPAGYLEARLGGRTLLLIYQLGSGLAFLLIIISDSLFQFTLGISLLGLCSSIYHPAGLTVISRRVTRLSKGMAIHGIFGSLGLAIGPIFASFFADQFGWRVVFGILLVAQFSLALATMALIKPSQGRDTVDNDLSLNDRTNLKALAYYYGVAALMGFAYTGFTTFIPTHFALATRDVIASLSDVMRGGTFTTMVLLAGILGQVLGGKWGGKYDKRKLLFWIVAANIPLFMILGVVSGASLVLFGIMLGIVHFSLQPIGNSMIAEFTASKHRGLAYGVSFFFSFGVGAVAAGVSGWIAETFSLPLVFPVLGIILIPGLWLAYRIRKFH